MDLDSRYGRMLDGLADVIIRGFKHDNSSFITSYG